MSQVGEGGAEPQLATTPNGDAISAWVSHKAGVAGTVDARIALGAAGYGPVQALSSATPAPQGLKLATSADGTTLAAWIQGGSIGLARRAPGSSTFALLPGFTPPGAERPQTLSVGFEEDDAYVLYGTFDETAGKETTRVRVIEIPSGGNAEAVGEALDSYPWAPGSRWSVALAPVVGDAQHHVFAAWQARELIQHIGFPPEATTSVRVALRGAGPQFNAREIADEAHDTEIGTPPSVGAPWLAAGPGGRVTVGYPYDLSNSSHKLRLRDFLLEKLTSPEDASVTTETVRLAYDPLGTLLVALNSHIEGSLGVLAAERPSGGPIGTIALVSPPGVIVAGEIDLRTGADGSAAVAYAGYGPGESVNVALRSPGGVFAQAAAATPALQFPGSVQVALGGAGPRVQWITGEEGPVEQAVLDAVPPVLSGLSVPAEATVGTPVTLSVAASDALSSVALAWDFGDGSSGSGGAVAHVYAATGSFTVKVTAIDAAGNLVSLTAPIVVGARHLSAPAVSAPTISGFRLSPSRFAASRKTTAVSATATAKHRRRATPRGSAFVLKLSQDAKLVFTITDRVRVHGHLRTLKVGTITRRTVRAGSVRIPFSGRLGRRGLAPGVYTASVVATNSVGVSSKSARVTFTIVR
jgi:PKD repeat protein